ncbi:MAG: MOSC N-terminal beta barrel domain-containing protein [Alphaproteobacteria bacterium]|nr:MOSC N-terminal beta barrel domain-containing protein [Alphaproteobacteria bacterium]
MPEISQIIIYPFKSLPGIKLSSARFTSAGILEGDREFAFFTSDGRFVNGKRFEAIHHIRTSFDLSNRLITLWSDTKPYPQSFHMDQQCTQITTWVSQQLNLPNIELKHNPIAGFPDDTKSPGPTLATEASLIAAGNYFNPIISLEEMIERMRVNILISDVEAYWEDTISTNAETGGILKLGDIKLIVTNPCQRCIVPTRNPQTGIATPQFIKTFMQQRYANLPLAVKQDLRYERNSYRLSVNVLGPSNGAIHVRERNVSIEENRIPLRKFDGKTSTELLKNNFLLN